MSYDQDEADGLQSNGKSAGLITQPHRGVSIAAVAEQHRAITEIQAALTVAQQCPRDEAKALDRILTTCQRAGVAQEAEYEYSRGGESISGATIKLLEVVAQQWGNLEFGFRELARYPGVGGQAGESTVEAFAWDLQSNTRRKVQFTVKHVIGRKSGDKVLSDSRDIYELIANQSQRRVRTCLENIIPRDIVDAARDECRTTMETNEQVTPERLKKLTEAFAPLGVTKEMIETRLQRKLETMSPAQMVRLRRIFKSLQDRVADVADFFTVAESEKPKSTLDAAKDKLKKKAPAKAPDTKPFVPDDPTADHVDDNELLTPPKPQAAPDQPAAIATNQAKLDHLRKMFAAAADRKQCDWLYDTEHRAANTEEEREAIELMYADAKGRFPRG
jgi:hypothetical protein